MKKAKLTIKDEVNVRFTGLYQSDINDVIEKTKIFVPSARHTAAFKMKVWDGKESQFQENGATKFFMLDKVLPILESQGYDIDVVDNRKDIEFTPDKIDELFLHEYGIGLRYYQVDSVNEVIDNDKGILELPTSAGKAQPLTSDILTPYGWVKMKDLSVGDYVIGSDGKKTKVTGIYPQGKKSSFKVETTYGASVECCEEHLWNVRTKYDSNEGKGFRTLTLSELAERYKTGNENYWQLPVISPIEYDCNDNIFIDPYVLGVLIGDGSLCNHVIITNPEQDIIDNVKKLLHESDTINEISSKRRCPSYGIRGKKRGDNSTRKYLQYYGLMGTRSHEKFIPKAFLTASIETRINLLAGLLDTDGHVDTRGRIEYSTSSEQLSSDIVDLVMGLGGYASVSSNIPTFTYKGERRKGRRSYRLYINLHLDGMVKSEKNLKKINLNTRIKANCITNITYVGEKEMQCISVDAEDHLYVTNGYTLTHNTIISGAITKAYDPQYRTIIIVPSENLATQTFNDVSGYDLDVGKITGKITGKKREAMWQKRHLVITWQTLNRNRKYLKNYDIVIQDEIHEIGTVMYDVLANDLSHAHIRVGLTGTVPDDKHKAELIKSHIGGDILYSIDPKELMDQDYISTVEIELVPTQHLIDLPNKSKLEWDTESKYLNKNKDRIRSITEYIRNLKKTLNGNFLILSFPEIGKAIANELGSDFIDKDVDTDVRETYYKKYDQQTDYDLVATYRTVGTGISIDNIQYLITIDLGKNKTRVLQSIGRGLRKDGEENHLKVFDIYAEPMEEFVSKSGEAKPRVYGFSAKPHLQQRLKIYKNNEYQYYFTENPILI